MPLLVYIASPYSAPTEAERLRNVERSFVAGRALMERGHVPFMPLLNHWFDAWHEREQGCELNPEIYMEWDVALLARCDGLLFLGSSPGADREKALAESLGLPVWLAVEDVAR